MNSTSESSVHQALTKFSFRWIHFYCTVLSCVITWDFILHCDWRYPYQFLELFSRSWASTIRIWHKQTCRISLSLSVYSFHAKPRFPIWILLCILIRFDPDSRSKCKKTLVHMYTGIYGKFGKAQNIHNAQNI